MNNKHSFLKQRKDLIGIERIIKAITGNDPDKVFGPNLKPYCSELRQLLHRRGLLLNSMLKETPEVYERMRLVNEFLYDWNNELHEQMASICLDYFRKREPSYKVDCEIVGLLGFSYNDENSILPLSLDADYGSDYSLMMAVNESLLRLEKYCPANHFEIGLECHCHYNQAKGIIVQDYPNECASNAHDLPLSFEGLCICHTTAAMVRDLHYPLFDLLHMNDFWSDIHVKYKYHSRIMDP